MDTLGMFLQEVIYFPLELLLAVLVFAHPLEPGKAYVGRLIAVALFSALFFLGYIGWMLRLPAPESDPMAADSIADTLIWCGMLFLIMTVGIWLTRAVSPREAIYCASCAYLAEHMAYCVRILLAKTFSGIPIEEGSFLYFLSLAVVYLLVYVFFVRRIVNDRHYAASAVDSIWLTLAVLGVVLVLSALATWYGFEFTHAVYALLSGVILMVSQVRYQKQLSLQKELELQRQLWRQQKAQYEISRENIDIINRKCHDLKHQLAAIKLVKDPEKQAQVIDDLQESVLIYDSILKTGNEILDTVLTEKSLLCSRYFIHLTCMADGAALAFRDAVDLYTLFGNALDNAIEASLGVGEKDRMIDVQARQKAGLVLISIVNRFEGELKFAGDLPETSKEDPFSHGYGLQSIRTVAEKYGGFLKIEAEEGLFTLRVTMPV